MRRGPPPGGFEASSACHLDGSDWNTAPDNLCWLLDKQFVEVREAKAMKRLMRPDFLPVRIKGGLIPAARPGLVFVGANNTPGWIPISPNNFKVKYANKSDCGSRAVDSGAAA